MPQQKTYYSIKFLSVLTGLWESYMNHTAWDTREQARKEINILKRSGKKLKSHYNETCIRQMVENNIHIPTPLIAQAYKIVTVKGHSIQQNP